MKTHDLRKLLEAVPYDFDVYVKSVLKPAKDKEQANNVYIDFENKLIVIGEVR